MSASGRRTSAPSSSRAPASDRLVEVGERRDQAHVVLVDERAQRGDVGGVVDPRHEGVPVGVIERGCERVRVGGDRQRAGATERADDVHPLSGAREEDGRHGGQYSRNGRLASAEATRIAATTSRRRPGRRSTA